MNKPNPQDENGRRLPSPRRAKRVGLREFQAAGTGFGRFHGATTAVERNSISMHIAMDHVREIVLCFVPERLSAAETSRRTFVRLELRLIRRRFLYLLGPTLRHAPSFTPKFIGVHLRAIHCVPVPLLSQYMKTPSHGFAQKLRRILRSVVRESKLQTQSLPSKTACRIQFRRNSYWSLRRTTGVRPRSVLARYARRSGSHSGTLGRRSVGDTGSILLGKSYRRDRRQLARHGRRHRALRCDPSRFELLD